MSNVRITRFRDVPRFTRDGSYECDYSPDSLLAHLDREVAEQGLDLDPDFQRPHVWTEAQQVAYIEFFLRGGKTARVIYLNNPHWHFRDSPYKDYVLVDGKQRLHAWRRFLADEIRVFGSLYSEYTDKMRLVNMTLRLNVNDLKTRAEVLQWYVDFNAGGVVHSAKEIARVRKLLDRERNGDS